MEVWSITQVLSLLQELLLTCQIMPQQQVVCHQFLANMGDTQISWLKELHLEHVTSCRMLSSTLLGDVFCCLFLSCVVMWQKSMLTWRHICHVGVMSQNVAFCWCYCHPACYGDTRQFQLSWLPNTIMSTQSDAFFIKYQFPYTTTCLVLKLLFYTPNSN